jgi:hypothetical protein
LPFFAGYYASIFHINLSAIEMELAMGGFDPGTRFIELGQLAGRENRRSPEGRKLFATRALTHRNLHTVSFRVISKMQKTRQNDGLRHICWVF